MPEPAPRLDTFKQGRAFLLDLASELDARKPKQRVRPRVEFVLLDHLSALAQRCRDISLLLTPDSFGGAAALTRTAVEITFSACYIANGHKAQREHRAVRYLDFGTVQSRAFIEWTEALGLWRDKAWARKVSEGASRALRAFPELEKDLRSGWWGRRNRLANIAQEIADNPFGPAMAQAYMALSFFVHPGPLGIGSAYHKRERSLYPMALLITLETSAALTLNALRSRSERKVKPINFEALSGRHFPGGHQPKEPE